MPEALCGGWPLLRAASVGRYAPPELVELSDLVSEIREIKHPYRRGIPARKVFVGYRFVHNP